MENKINSLSDLNGATIKKVLNTISSVIIKTDKGEVTVFANCIGMLGVRETVDGIVPDPNVKNLF